MVYYLRWAFWGVAFALFAAFLHYSVPQWDVVRITDTYEKRVEPGSNSLFWGAGDVGEAATPARDVFFVQAMRPDNKPIVYRNEDTGWGWPPFFKFDTANLQAEASDAKSTPEAAKWVAIKHYGWRSEILSVYPNALAIKPVMGSDDRVIPWQGIAMLVVMCMIVWAVTVRWLRFKRRRISPVLDRMDTVLDAWWMRLRGKR